MTAPSGADIGGTLSKKVGPLPIGAYVAVGTGLLAWYLYKRNQANAAATGAGSTTATNGTAGVVNSSQLAYPMPYSSDFNITVTNPAAPPAGATTATGGGTTATGGGTGSTAKPPTHLPAPTPKPKTSSLTYKVQPGDTLWGIASREYGNGGNWGKILTANRSTITATAAKHGMPGNGSYIYPGETLVIPK